MKASVFGTIVFLAVAAATTAPAVTEVNTAEAAQDFTYERAKIVSVKDTPDGGVLLVLDAGADQRIYEGSTGMVYVGTTQDFLSDDQGNKVRFEVKKVDGKQSEAVTIQGDVDADDFKVGGRVVLRARKAPTTKCQRVDTVNGVSIDSCVVAKIRKWDSVIDRVAAAKKVDPNLVRGVIAAESGGDEDEVSPSGYKGLMQASRNAADLKGENSIESGAQLLVNMEKYLRAGLNGTGVSLDSMSREAKLDALLASYNAGHRSVMKAIEYAGKDGKIDRWSDVNYFQRGVMFTGAYNSKAAFSWCVGKKPEAEKNKLASEAEAGRRAIIGKGFTPEQATAQGSPALTVCAAKFKATFSPRYRVKINAYRAYFDKAPKG